MQRVRSQYSRAVMTDIHKRAKGNRGVQVLMLRASGDFFVGPCIPMYPPGASGGNAGPGLSASKRDSAGLVYLPLRQCADWKIGRPCVSNV